MNPRLVAITGPLKGTLFSLTEEEVLIGRTASNHLTLRDNSVSRQHCLIKREAEQFKLCDLQSLNGTFINGLPVKERALEHGAQIRVGSSIFLFLLAEDEPLAAAIPVCLSEEKSLNQSTIQLRPEDALYFTAEKELLAAAPAGRAVRDLQAVLQIAAAINSIRKLEELQQRLLELIFEVTGAERGAILLVGETAGEFASLYGWDRYPEKQRPVQVSRTIINRVLSEGAGILSNDILAGEALNVADSLVSSAVRSALAVPLVFFGKTLGVIYLDTSAQATPFDEDHLELLAAIAGIAAGALERTRRMEWLEGENERLRGELNLERSMIGESARMQEVYQIIAKVAPTDATVLIRGESGTGKELVARAIHSNSPRAAQPFAAINCAALTETLLESELFGHEKGAFTGALARRQGRLEAADGGTVFLDEVGELPPAFQVKLLRVLQEREFERVGGTQPIKVNIRLLAATNRNLEEAVSDKSFRQDLYYRLNVVSLVMPPLSARREDIPLLASYFTAKHSEKCKRRVLGVSPEARACLMRYDWPGNVRELENVIERAVVLGSSDLIRPEDLPEAIVEMESYAGTTPTKYHAALREAKKQLILQAVERARGNYTEAAKLLGVHPNYLHRLIRNMNLKAVLQERTAPGAAPAS